MDTGERTDSSDSEARPNPSHAYLWPVLDRVVAEVQFTRRRAIDLGCGNGSTSERLRQQGYDMVGVDVGVRGIEIARKSFPRVKFHIDSVYADLAAKHGTFPLVVCLEVIEHLYDPRGLIRTIGKLLEPGGTVVLSTPFHGYWKNLGLAVMGRWDHHHQPLNQGGHIKFFSEETLVALLREEGLAVREIYRVGRAIPALARSMVVVAHRR